MIDAAEQEPTIQRNTCNTIDRPIMSTRTINVRIPEALYGQIEELAQATARSKSFLAIEALKSYVESESWQVRDIQAGIEEADAGDFASQEEVAATFAKYGA